VGRVTGFKHTPRSSGNRSDFSLCNNMNHMGVARAVAFSGIKGNLSQV
jgi:hypothetical protein